MNDDERALLAKISSIVRFKKGDVIYGEGDPAEAAFNIVGGVVTAYRTFGDGEIVTAFVFQGDLFGLSEEGRYTNSAKAATAVVAYKIPLSALRRILDQHADLDVDLIIKLCEELRQSQRHALLLARKRATTRLAMFIEMLERLQTARGEPASEVHLPMGRSSMAAYLGLTPAALSRAFHRLTSSKIVAARDRRHLKIVDRVAFQKLADTRSTGGSAV
ncbi:MAG TPA: Crp/Fnr family transcriptional regulator [Bradyrhizobium sp.]|uniref:Crp/Fnr family transcriptional regulator n=1 Tax=Bradyrhizobium sp. TaxID=376 RepID=UPI002D7F0762|nr:Crp/Fnr family transcriptional regulator [Bradyrhizobium sp.]HET7885277.1 Crp/Fnr family transcriptional regulator [Bradyrhizobium sp.]